MPIPIICPPQNIPISDALPGVGAMEPGRPFGKTWWLFFYNISKTVQDILALSSSTSGLQNSSGAWAARPAATSVPSGSFYTVTDRDDLLYQSRGGQWHYVSGVHRDVFANLPTTLAWFDRNYLYEVSDFSHIFRWDGRGWVPYNMEASGRFVDFGTISPLTHRGTCNTSGTAVTWKSGPLFDPKWGTINRIGINGVFYAVSSIAADGLSMVLASTAGTQTGVIYRMYVGWHYCDGNGDDNLPGGNVNTLALWTPPVTLAIVIPNLITSSAYRKAGSYDGVINAAASPTVSGSPAAASAGTPAGTVDAPTTTVDSRTLTTANFVTAGGTTPGVTEVSHAHTSSATAPAFTGAAMADHSHGAGTLGVSLAGDPIANYLATPWYRK